MAARWVLFAIGLGGCLAASAAQAQANGPVPGPYGAEDGYNDDGFGWGPAYRPETNFRPATGFYGGVERPYPYGQASTGEQVANSRVKPRQARVRHVRRTRRAAQSRANRSRSE